MKVDRVRMNPNLTMKNYWHHPRKECCEYCPEYDSPLLAHTVCHQDLLLQVFLLQTLEHPINKKIEIQKRNKMI